MDLRRISDQDLLSKTKELVARERELITEILRHLREIERRRLFADLGYSSLYDYCMKGLGYSEAETKSRIDAMRLIRELPQIEEHVTSGELSLTNLVKAKSFFRQEEKAGPMGMKEKLEVIDTLKNKSTREVEKVLLAQASVEPPAVKEKIRQVTAEVAEVKFAADDNLLNKMKRLRGLLAYKNPDMKTSELINELCEIALDRLDPVRKKTRAEKKSEKLPNIIRRAPDVKNPRNYISVKTKQEVWKKSDGKCKNCQSEFALETDHNTPIALGGSSEAENLSLLCRNCNQRAAIVKLGQQTMDRYLT
jgi:5-methylcytosine-specific restriction endonuclease McrA